MARSLFYLLSLVSSYALASRAPSATCEALATSAAAISASSAAASHADFNPQGCPCLSKAARPTEYSSAHATAEGPTAPYPLSSKASAITFGTGNSAHGTAPIGGSRKSAAPDVWVTEIVTAYTTFCPKATALTVNGHTYTATESETLTITHCPGGCRLTRPASAISAATVTAIVPHVTKSLAGPATASLQGSSHTVLESTTLTVSTCSGGCTVTTPLLSLVSAGQATAALTHQPQSTAYAAPTGAFPSGAINGTGSHFASTGFTARPTTDSGALPVPTEASTGDASTNSFGFGIVVLAWLVTFM